MGKRGARDVNRTAWVDRRVVREVQRNRRCTDRGERQAFKQLRPHVRGHACLDIGVGGGRTTAILQPLAAEYVGVDLSPAMVEVCRARFPDADIRVGDACDLSQFPPHHFDVVVFSLNGIDSMEKPERATVLREVCKVLRPGGYFQFSTHNLDGPGPRERPWSLPHGLWIRPDRIARNFVGQVRGLRTSLTNYRTNQTYQVDGDGWAIRTAAAHRFGIVIHYTTLEHLRLELATAGFDPEPVVLDQRTGGVLDSSSDLRRVWYFQVIARTL